MPPARQSGAEPLTRRLLLATVGSATTLSLAGCLGGDQVVADTKDYLAGDWRGTFSGRAVEHMVGMYTIESGFTMDIVNLTVDTDGATIKRTPWNQPTWLSAPFVADVEVRYREPVGHQPGCRIVFDVEPQVTTGRVEGEIEINLTSEDERYMTFDEASLRLLYATVTSTHICDDSDMTSGMTREESQLLGAEQNVFNGEVILRFTSEDSMAIDEIEGMEIDHPAFELPEIDLSGQLYKVYWRVERIVLPIEEPVEIETDEHTRKDVELPDERRVQLDAESKMGLSCSSQCDLDLFYGRMIERVKKAKSYEVATPVAVAAVRGTDFHVAVEGDGTTEVIVFDGGVEVSDKAGEATVVVEQNQQTTVAPGQHPTEPVHVDPNEVPRWWR